MKRFDPTEWHATKRLSKRHYAFLSIGDTVEIRANGWQEGEKETFHFLAADGTTCPIGGRADPKPTGFPSYTPGTVTLRGDEMLVGLTTGGGKHRTPLVHVHATAAAAARHFGMTL